MPSRKTSPFKGDARFAGRPSAKKTSDVKKFVAIGAGMMAVGAVVSWFVMEDQSALEGDQSDLPQTSEDSRAHGLESAVTRALSADLSTGPAALPPQTVLRAPSRNDCERTLGQLTAAASGPVSGDDATQLARALALGAKGCDGVTVTIQGHVSGGADEIENLSASWQQAEGIINALAQEGLDVGLFQPLGFGSRFFGEAGAKGAYVSFRIAPYGMTSPG